MRFYYVTFISIFSVLHFHFVCTKIQFILQNPKVDRIIKGYDFPKLSSNNFRIHFHYTDSFTSYPDSDIIENKIMEPAKRELEVLLKVKYPLNGFLRVDRSCTGNKLTMNKYGVKGCVQGCDTDTTCLGISIPEEYLKECRTIKETGEIIYSGNEGRGKASTDIVIIVSYIYCPDMSHANAASCFSENQFDRPILGVIELCRGSFDANSKILESIKIVQHEIIHVLGFAVDKYAFFRYSNGDPIVPRNQFGLPTLGLHPEDNYYLWNDRIIKKVERNRESIHGPYMKTMYAFVLENVVKVAREHFKCPSIDAVDLEDEGDVGSRLTHFDEYFLHNEIMTPQTNNGNDVISKFTLALLKDTGWYDADLSKAEELEYGKGKGCILPLEGCYRYMEKQRKSHLSLDPFCDRVLQFGNIARCSDKQNYFDYCHLTKYNDILKQNQYFHVIPGVRSEDVQHYAGHSKFSEFCPTKIIFKNPNSICSDIGNTGLTEKYNIVPSYYGPDSLCFEYSLSNDPGNVYYGASCQKFSYNASLSQVQVYFGSKSFTCPSNIENYFKIENYFIISFKCPRDLKNIIPKTTFPGEWQI